MQSLTLSIHNMEERHWGLTQATAANWTEGARVCLDRHHQSPVAFQISWAELNADALVEWEQTDEHTRGAWANQVDATEAGAYACVLAGVASVLRCKLQQAADGNSNLPAIVGVVGFRVLVMLLAYLEEP